MRYKRQVGTSITIRIIARFILFSLHKIIKHSGAQKRTPLHRAQPGPGKAQTGTRKRCPLSQRDTNFCAFPVFQNLPVSVETPKLSEKSYSILHLNIEFYPQTIKENLCQLTSNILQYRSKTRLKVGYLAAYLSIQGW